MDHGAAKLTGLDLVFDAHHRRTFVRIEESRGGSKRQPCLANIAVTAFIGLLIGLITIHFP